jgi:hypothetical protein
MLNIYIENCQSKKNIVNEIILLSPPQNYGLYLRDNMSFIYTKALLEELALRDYRYTTSISKLNALYFFRKSNYVKFD